MAMRRYSCAAFASSAHASITLGSSLIETSAGSANVSVTLGGMLIEAPAGFAHVSVTLGSTPIDARRGIVSKRKKAVPLRAAVIPAR